ncbi:MAG: hypothetical protein ACOYN4_02950 [Bacteroidales bacterium]
MSYTRKYSDSITVSGSKSVSVSYPASQNGGTTTATVHYTEVVPVDVNIHVDTNPFDNSVQHCDNNVNMLTAAVVATESAEIISKELNSKKVANTIIGGFFSYIRSEISQQIAELTQNIEAQTMHLTELMHACTAKTKQMEGDFNRISSRYVKIFDDLNHELSNRIIEMDKPTFVFKKETDNQKIRTSDNDLINTIAIFGKEGGDLQAKIGSSIAKKRAFDTLIQAKSFLWQQKTLSSTIQQSMLNQNMESSLYSPVCFIETQDMGNHINKKIYSTPFLSGLTGQSQQKKILEMFASQQLVWVKLKPIDQQNIRLYFNTELNSKSPATDLHSERVRDMIQKIANINSVNAIQFQQN